MVYLSRYCIACRRLIPEDIESPVLVIAPAEAKWQAKKHKHVVKLVGEDCQGLCLSCAEEMNKLMEAQIAKGAKVI